MELTIYYYLNYSLYFADYKIIKFWGDYGTSDGYFRQPYGSMVYDDTVFISDCTTGRV